MRTFRRIAAVVALAAIGLGLLLYPMAANWFAVLNQAKELTGYTHAVDSMPTEEQERMLASAEDYNERLAAGQTGGGAVPDADYLDELAPQPGDVMAQVTIPAIHASLPVYHGTGEDSLQRGVGHLFGSALPVGGEGNHTVLSAHSGLVDKELFTHLDEVEIGDHFSIAVVGRTLAYEVDQITVIAPDDTTVMQPVAGEDYVTLLTCAPVGVNSHRLAVRGHRIEPVPEADQDAVVGGHDGDVGFPWWAVIFVGGVALVTVVGERLSRPVKPQGTDGEPDPAKEVTDELTTA